MRVPALAVQRRFLKTKCWSCPSEYSRDRGSLVQDGCSTRLGLASGSAGSGDSDLLHKDTL